jgi:stage V sporulation protein AD
MTISGGYAKYVLSAASSHFGSAEKQFRFPLEYGNQRAQSSTWTVTGCGAFVLSDTANPCLEKKKVLIKGATIGKIVDYDVKDAQNMGAAMAPAAAHVIYQALRDHNKKAEDFDRIITGDLGKIGKQLLINLLKENNIDISANHLDCGIEIFENNEQDTHSGGSGCACSAVVLASFLLNKIEEDGWENILFVPTGAMFSPTSFNEGKAVPGIAHAVVIEAVQ